MEERLETHAHTCPKCLKYYEHYGRMGCWLGHTRLCTACYEADRSLQASVGRTMEGRL